jgi:hypothetical protein
MAVVEPSPKSVVDFQAQPQSGSAFLEIIADELFNCCSIELHRGECAAPATTGQRTKAV